MYQSEGPFERENQSANPKKSGLRSVLSTVGLIIIAVVVAFSVSFFVFQSYQVEGQSMETTLKNGDRLIVNKVPVTFSKITSKDFVPARGSIIIFEQVGFVESSERQLIKRVIGLPGDRMVIKEGVVTIFNTAHPTGYNPDTSGEYSVPETAKLTSGNVDTTVEAGEIFVLGDNRANSADSRIFGPINSSSVIGQLVMRILPLSEAETF